MHLKRFKILLIFILAIFIFFAGCRKEKFEGPQIKENIVVPATYKEFVLADFEDGGVLNSKYEVGTETWGTGSIKQDTANPKINYYFRLVNSINVTWDWYLGGIRMKAVKFGNADSVFHFNMDSTNIANTYFNFHLAGNPNIDPKAFIVIQVITKSPVVTYQYEITLNFTGWRLYSIPFDAFITSANLTINNLNNIREIDIILLHEIGKNPGLIPIDMLLDNIVITQNGTYNP
ncbi:MAG: hypothetical protein PHD97_10105 [Bacteroidales bacterium]|nr:hypothetical protein [Bacteroidales bacterium]